MKINRIAFRHAVQLCFPDSSGGQHTTVSPAEAARLDAFVDWGRRIIVLKGRTSDNGKVNPIYRIIPFEVIAHLDVLQSELPELAEDQSSPTVPLGAMGKPKGKDWFVKAE